jgi:hypothetical protein
MFAVWVEAGLHLLRVGMAEKAERVEKAEKAVGFDWVGVVLDNRPR